MQGLHNVQLFATIKRTVVYTYAHLPTYTLHTPYTLYAILYSPDYACHTCREALHMCASHATWGRQGVPCGLDWGPIMRQGGAPNRWANFAEHSIAAPGLQHHDLEQSSTPTDYTPRRVHCRVTTLAPLSAAVACDLLVGAPD